MTAAMQDPLAAGAAVGQNAMVAGQNPGVQAQAGQDSMAGMQASAAQGTTQGSTAGVQTVSGSANVGGDANATQGNAGAAQNPGEPVVAETVEQAATLAEQAAAAGAEKVSAQDVKIEMLLEECVRQKASDLHLQVGLPPILRVDGVLHPIPNMPVITEDASERLVFSTMDSLQQQSLMKDKEFDYSFAFGSLGRFRVNAFQERGALAAAFRLIPDKILSVAELGLPNVVDTFTEYPRGLVLVTGPTGSGKSTTLAALLEKINMTKPVHILTIEDPIEFTYTSKRAVVVQREVHYDTLSFSRALRSALRQDPDVVLIGEMRDLETMQAALTVAETGHLVFGTLHTNSAAQSVDRIVDVFPAHQQPQIRLQLSSVLQAVCSQRLVPAIGGGRVAATEIMVTNQAIKALIRDGKTHQIDTAIQTGVAQGMQTMDRTLVKMIQGGIISYDDAREYAVDLVEFERLARG